jgi:nucleotide-binding universal stress UspA family protein
MPASHTPTIVVGFDGSPASRTAVEYAIDRVADGHLVVVHAYQVPTDHIGASYSTDMVATASNRAALAMDELERDCQRLAEVDYETDVIAGQPAQTICAVAATRHADEIVVGSRGLGRMRSLLGSVAHDVIHEAGCPVLVIPERMVSADPSRSRTAAVAS